MKAPDFPLIPDTPISSRANDAFGRVDFADNLAKAIAGVPAKSGFVFALNAPWGSGKTSTLKMVQEALEKDPEVGAGKQFITVEFNPWWFSGGDSLARNFLGQFGKVMKKHGKEISGAGEEINRIADGIDALGSVLTTASVFPEPHVATAAATGGGVAKSLARVVKWLSSGPAQDIHGIRESAHNLLYKMSDLRVLVVMDDLDRIQPNEIREMFRLIKGVADFPNTIYLLSFDREVVIDAITDKSGNSETGRNNAERYLGKIIQMFQDLPPVNKLLLRNYFCEQVIEVLKPIPPDHWDDRYWESVMQEALNFLQTPRDAKQWLNNVGATYPMIRGEVNPMDFVAIQGIRTFVPEIYDAVAGNKPLFVEVPGEGPVVDLPGETEKTNRKQATELCKEVFASLSKKRRMIAEHILMGIFPFWNSHFRPPGGNYPLEGDGRPRIIPDSAHIEPGGSPYESKLARHPDIFDKYFHLSVPAWDFSVLDMAERIERAKRPVEFSNMLVALAKQFVPGKSESRLQIFLQHLSEMCQKESVLQNAEGILQAFLTVGDSPEIARKWSVRTMGADMMRIAYSLLQGIPDEDKRFRICLNAYEKAEAVMEMWEWTFLFRDALKNPDEGSSPPLMSQGRYDALEKIAVQKLQDLAKMGDVWNWRDPIYMLYRIDQEVSKEARRECVMQAIASQEGFADFCAQVQWKGAMASESIKQLEYLSDMNRQQLVARAHEIMGGESSLSDERQEALHRLIQWVKNPRAPADSAERRT